MPGQSTVIVFKCESCGHKIKIPDKYAGKKGKCPKCHEAVIIPTPEKEDIVPEDMVKVTCQMCGQVIEVPAHANEAFIECPSCSSYIETSLGSAMVESDAFVPPPIDEQQHQEESEEYEEPAGIDRRLIVIISAVAAVVVVGLIILVTALKLSRPEPQRQPQIQVAVDAPESRVTTDIEGRSATDLDGAKAFAERYISLLENGEINEACNHYSPDLAKDLYKFPLEQLSERIGSNKITEMNCTRTQRQQFPDGERISLWYDLSYEQGTQSVEMTILSTGQDFKVDRISAKDSQGNSTSIGLSPQVLTSLSGRAATPRRARPSSGGLFTAILSGFAIGTFFSAVCLWIGMKITRVEGTFVAMLGIAAISSLANIIPSVFCFIPCVGLLFNLAIMLVLICKWTDAELWPDAIGMVLISGFVGMFAIRLLNFITSMA